MTWMDKNWLRSKGMRAKKKRLECENSVDWVNINCIQITLRDDVYKANQGETKTCDENSGIFCSRSHFPYESSQCKRDEFFN